MTKVLLVNPPSPERVGSPLLGQQYVAAALLGAGCEVRVIDAAARCFDHDLEWTIAEAERFSPDIVGFTLFTKWVRRAYALAERMRGRYPMLVAGGPHATACPDETLARGFDVAVIGEAEESAARLADVVRGTTALRNVPGIKYLSRDGAILEGGMAAPLDNLDSLAWPQISQDLFDPRWYSDSGSAVIPGGIMTSRGCPAGCIFCANYVTGRKIRSRSAGSVVAELTGYHSRYGTSFFQFWDDAFSADPRRVHELCDAIRNEISFPLSWSAGTRVTMVEPEMLHALKAAGLSAIVFGAESGDDEILKAIGKGITTDSVVRALEWAKAAGLTTVCDFMLGFPQDTAASLERTLSFMERISPLVDCFNTLGVVVPLPGTPLYNECHERYGFTDWWLDERYDRFEPPPSTDDAGFRRYYCGDPILDHDFFRYSDETRQMIRACLEFKAEHNLKLMGIG